MAFFWQVSSWKKVYTGPCGGRWSVQVSDARHSDPSKILEKRVRYKGPARCVFLPSENQTAVQAEGIRTIYIPLGISYLCILSEFESILSKQHHSRLAPWQWCQRFPLLEIFLLALPAIKELLSSSLWNYAFMPLITVACPVRNETHFFIPLRVHCQKFNEYALPAEDIPRTSFFSLQEESSCFLFPVTWSN